MKISYIFASLLSFSLLALSPEEKFTHAYELVNAGEYEEALTTYQELAKQFPHHIELLNNIGFTLKKQNKMHEAIEIYQKARSLSPKTNSRIERAISHAYLALGDFEHGWPAYEYRWVNPPAYNQELKSYIENGGSLHNKTILIHTEYGLGDTLQFIRYAQILKSMGAKVVVEAQPSLVKLLSLCPYIDTVFAAGESWPMHDFKALLMSLPLILQSKTKEVAAQSPYLFADQELRTQWHERISNSSTIKIGICWQADTHKNSDYSVVNQDSIAKSIPLKLLSKVCKLPYVSLYSLQKINGTEQLSQLPKNVTIHQFDDLDTAHGPFMDTAALMQSLDLVITIDTSIAHLAGGLGVPVWLLLPAHADWRWQLDCLDTPWYPTMKLFRQSSQGVWDDVLLALSKELIETRIKEKNKNSTATQISFEDLGLAAIKDDELEDAYLFHQQILAVNPQNAGAINNCAYILSRLNQFDKAIESYEKLLALKPDSKGAYLGLAKAYLAAGNFAKGWAHLEWRFPNPAEYQRAFGYLNLQPSQIRGKTFLIRAEWGFGDMIQFVRYAELLKQAGAKKVTIQTFEQLKPLFIASGLADEIIAVGESVPHADIQIPCMSLPLLFNTLPETIPASIPYLAAKPTLIESWKQKLTSPKALKVGICWRAKQIGFIEDFKHTRRSIPLEEYAPLFKSPHAAFYNLQKDASPDELNLLAQHNVTTFPADFDENNGRFMDTAAVMMNLDFIITADTCTAHLAAALGKQVWLLLPYTAEWRWLPGDSRYSHKNSTPWYPNNMKLIKQKTPGSWKSVIKKAIKDLDTAIKAKGTQHAL